MQFSSFSRTFIEASKAIVFERSAVDFKRVNIYVTLLFIIFLKIYDTFFMFTIVLCVFGNLT